MNPSQVTSQGELPYVPWNYTTQLPDYSLYGTGYINYTDIATTKSLDAGVINFMTCSRYGYFTSYNGVVWSTITSPPTINGYLTGMQLSNGFFGPNKIVYCNQYYYTYTFNRDTGDLKIYRLSKSASPQVWSELTHFTPVSTAETCCRPFEIGKFAFDGSLFELNNKVMVTGCRGGTINGIALSDQMIQTYMIIDPSVTNTSNLKMLYRMPQYETIIDAYYDNGKYIIIDDGGHTMNQQIVTYEELYDHLSDNGVYLCEDVHTSYWTDYGGGLNEKQTFIEYSKRFIDMINFYHIRNYSSEEELIKSKKFRQTTNSIHYYDSIIVLEKEVDLMIPTASIR
jgi:hypothetical protein